jgi:3-oxoacyl-(acyl-carrier-protein) synthase
VKSHPRPVCVTGLGAVSCLGTGASAFWERVSSGESGIVDGLGAVALPGVSTKKFEGRGFEFSLIAAREALNQASIETLRPEDGFILATTTGQIDIWSSEFVEFLKQKSTQEDLEVIFRHQSLGALLDSVSATLGAPGKRALITSACSAATQALALGAMWIRQGKVKRCLVGGVEILSALTVEGFKSLQLLSSGPARPFDQGRKGINLSEGAGFLVLEAEESRKNPALGFLSGFGLTTDAFHMTGPHPEGQGCFEAMSRAVDSSGLKASDISWVHAHGTGSDQNDLSEGRAIARFFDAHQPAPPVTSTKYSHGHALGASGALESILCIESLRRQVVLKSGGLEMQDERIPITVVRESGPMRLNHILKNTLGFGGVNAALVFSRGEP